MSLPISTMIGIRTGGIVSGATDVDDMKKRIVHLVETKDILFPDIDVLDMCISVELHGCKGSYMVMAGVFNHWGRLDTFEFARLLSEEFGTEVMVMTWNEMSGRYGCNIFLAGKPLDAVNEDPVSRILRRTN